MELELTYDSQDAIPAGFEELYTERDGTWHLTAIKGIKSQADIDKINGGLRKERQAHKETKDKLKTWEDWANGRSTEDLQTELDEKDELQARIDAGEGGEAPDESAIQKLVDARVRREVTPIQRERDRLAAENEELNTRVGDLSGTITRGKVESAIRDAATAAKLLPTAIDDALTAGGNIFELTEEGEILTRDNVGVTPGVAPDVWLTEMQERRPHWWPNSQGGGAGGSNDNSPNLSGNPWSAKGWNKTEQGRIVREQGIDKAKQLAKAAGVEVGAVRPKETSETA